jgi:hypothetical protein
VELTLTPGGSTVKRSIIGGSACCAALLTLACGAGAAPIPKEARAGTGVPDLKATFDTVEKAVQAEKWPAEADEKKLTDSVRAVFDRMLKAAEQKERGLPVDFSKLKKHDVTAAFKSTSLSEGYVVAGDVRITSARKSLIFASGDVQITSASNCVIVARNVRCTGVDNCLVVAGEYVRLTSARQGQGRDPSVLLAGQWIRTTSMDGTVCHVLRPTGQPAPDEGRFAGNRPAPAIRTNGARGVIFLNEQADTGANGPKNCTYLPQKTPIAK